MRLNKWHCHFRVTALHVKCFIHKDWKDAFLDRSFGCAQHGKTLMSNQFCCGPRDPFMKLIFHFKMSTALPSICVIAFHYPCSLMTNSCAEGSWALVSCRGRVSENPFSANLTASGPLETLTRDANSSPLCTSVCVCVFLSNWEQNLSDILIAATVEMHIPIQTYAATPRPICP